MSGGAGVRRVRVDEGEKVRAARLAALAEEEFRRHFLREEERMTSDDWAARAKRGAESEDFATFIMVTGDTPEGIADGLLRDRNAVEVGGMWVQPEQRGRGIGRLLLEAVKDWALGRGATCLELTVVTTNRPAMALYEHAGFVPVGHPQPAQTVAGVMVQRMERPI